METDNGAIGDSLSAEDGLGTEESLSAELRASELAAQVLALSRDTLFVSLRFMQRSIVNVEFRPYTGNENVLFACDGRNLYFDPMYVLAKYRESANSITRAILHSVLHCVFHHGWTGGSLDTELWDLACDIAVENVISQLGCNAASDPCQALQEPLLEKLSEELPLMNAENIYRYLVREMGSETQFCTPGNDETPQNGTHESRPTGSSQKNVERVDAEKEQEIGSGGEAQKRRLEKIRHMREPFKLDQHSLWPDRAEMGVYDDSIDLLQIWQETSRRMQTEIETMGDSGGVLAASLQRVNRNKQSYARFLRRFGNHGEIMRVSDDEYDNNYYSYGLKLYGNIPLVEPLEYREQKHIREFVVAIDTSGSVQGETVRKFVQRTYDLIKSQETFDIRMKLHIIQCDDRVREDVVITSDDGFERYMSSMQIRGLGKTDFRPVFSHVNKLLEDRKLTNLAGLLYFTDGQGIFPSKKPPYDTAFIIRSEEVYPPEVPPWAMRVLLEEEMQ